MISLTVAVTLVVSCLAFELFKKFLDCDIVAVPSGYAGLKRNKWKNTLGSFIHAAFVGLTGLYW